MNFAWGNYAFLGKIICFAAKANVFNAMKFPDVPWSLFSNPAVLENNTTPYTYLECEWWQILHS